MTADTTQAVKITGNKAQYDEKAKWLLSRKIFLAHILEKTIDEFKGMTPDDIIPYIEGEPYVSKIPVNAGLTNQVTDRFAQKALSSNPKNNDITYNSRISGLNTEDASINEGVIYYDLIFYVRMKDGIAQIIINIEAQQNLPAEYHILNRAVFYSSRMISSQKGRDFFKSDYDSIKQVYSIWICMNMDDNSMNHFYLADKKILGNHDWNYDKSLINIILIGLSNDLPEQTEQYELHRLLGAIFSKKLSVNEKLTILKQEYHIETENTMKEVVNTMCNLSEGIWQSGIQVGEERGIQIGEERGEARMILNMKQAGFPLEQIAEIAKCSVEKIQEIIEKHKDL